MDISKTERSQGFSPRLLFLFRHEVLKATGPLSTGFLKEADSRVQRQVGQESSSPGGLAK